jgi:hypothetical protein
MTPHDPTTFDPRIADWLEDDPNNAPDQALDIVLAAFPSIKQRHASRLPRRFTMTTLPRLALWAAAIVVVVLAGAFLFRPPNSGVGGAAPSPSPSTTPSTAPSPTASIDMTGWVPFTSTRYGYVISHPSTSSTQPSTRAWSLATDRTDWLSTAADAFNEPSTRFTVFAAPIPGGTTANDWISAYFDPVASGSASPDPSSVVCVQSRVDPGPIAVDGHPATFYAEAETGDCGGSYAFVPVGNQMYVFVVWLGGKEQLLEAYLSTVRFQS